MTSDRRKLDMLMRSGLGSFARVLFAELAPGEALLWNWHLDAICHQLDRVFAGIERRLIIEVPPRSLKSVLGSVMFPAYVLGRDPTRKIITASYSLDLARKHANDCRAVMRTQRYRDLFPCTLLGAGNKDTEADFATSRRGYRYSTSPSGTLTGRGGDLLILDDIMSAADAASDLKRGSTIDWYRNTAYSRLNDKLSGAIIVITQRLHVSDLVGVLREEGGWTVFSLPAICSVEQTIDLGWKGQHRFAVGDLLHPAREPQSALDDLKRTLGSYNFSAQYLQQPVPIDGATVRWDWFLRYDELPASIDTIVQSWDIAMSEGANADWSVCTTWAMHGPNYYLVDVTRGRWQFPELLRRVGELGARFGANTILIEDMVGGTSLIQQLREQKSTRIPLPIALKPVGDKLSRFVSETPAIEAGHILLPHNAPWLDELRRELAQFPNGRHDDQVDSVSQFLNWARTRPKGGVRRMKLNGR